MSSINYLKLDIRLIKGTLKYYAVIPLLFLFMGSKESPIMALGYLFFFLIILATVPFSAESNERCEKMYYMLPSKVSSIVLGRFLYLISAMIIIWMIDGGIMMYSYKINKISDLDVATICLSGVVATIVCFCQYPLYYKFGMEKGKILSTILYMVPAFIVFALPSLLKNSRFLTPELGGRLLELIMSNKIILSLLTIVIIGIIGFISYLFSWDICEKREI